MKNKKILVGLFGLTVFMIIGGCIFINKNTTKEILKVQTIENYNISTYITEEISKNTMVSKVSAMIAYSTAPDSLDDIADTIALVKIISLDGASMEYDGFVGMTYGTMLINNVIRGNIKIGEVVSYIKPGGTVSMKEWENYQPDAANKKRASLREESGNNIDLEKTYINTLVENDIDIEVGKTYFAYFKYNEKLQKYEIIGLGNGLREVNIPKYSKSVTLDDLNLNNVKIKNNDTGQYELLSEYITQNIKTS